MLTTKYLRRINAGDYQLNTIQDALADFAELIAKQPILDGNLFTSIAVTSGTAFTIQHGLNRAYVGYIVTRVQGANQITVRETTSTFGNTLGLTLVPSATGTIDVWVF